LELTQRGGGGFLRRAADEIELTQHPAAQGRQH
jgi:hypothetical protein